MAARRGTKHEENEGQSFVQRLIGSEWRRISSVVLILLLFGGGAWLMWKRFGDQVLEHASYQLDPQNIQYTSPPEWLQQDILAEVVRDGSLEALQIHQPDLTVHIAGAFEQHPWVHRVQSVRKKYPAAVEVKLTYRSPVGMVVVPSDLHPPTALQPIDAAGVSMPGETYITPEFASGFPRIFVGHTLPAAPLGAGWGDPVVIDAAKLAELLYADWESLGDTLYQIQLSSQPTSATNSPDFDIRSRQEERNLGLLIHWGRAPGKELAGEPNANAKLANIKEWLTDRQRNEQLPVGELDVRSMRTISAMLDAQRTRQ